MIFDTLNACNSLILNIFDFFFIFKYQLDHFFQSFRKNACTQSVRVKAVFKRPVRSNPKSTSKLLWGGPSTSVDSQTKLSFVPHSKPGLSDLKHPDWLILTKQGLYISLKVLNLSVHGRKNWLCCLFCFMLY